MPRPSRLSHVAGLALLPLGVLAAVAAPAAAQLPYDLNIVVPTGSYALNSSGCSDISNQGRVLGNTRENDTYRWFEWTHAGGFSWLPVLFQSPTNPAPSAGRLNDLGDRLFGNLLVLADGTHVQIPLVDGTISLPSLQDLNDDLLLVGSGPNGTSSQILVWDPVNASKTIPIYGAKTLFRVSESGLAVGYINSGISSSRAFVVDVKTGVWTDVGQLLNGGGYLTWSDAVDVNEYGVVTGSGTTPIGKRAYTWSAAQGFVLLPPLEVGYEQYVVPSAIDDAGQVVGGALTSDGYHAFLWNPQTGMHDLNDLAPTGTFILQSADDISETGVIIGYGFFGPAWGPSRGFILDPATPWQYEGFAKAGAGGAPRLDGTGTLAGGTAAALLLTNASPSSLALAVVGPTATPTPFEGGMLLPVPPLFVLPLTTGGDGTLTLPFTVPAGGLPNAQIWFQFAIADATATFGVGLSNALKASFP